MAFLKLGWVFNFGLAFGLLLPVFDSYAALAVGGGNIEAVETRSTVCTTQVFFIASLVLT